MGVEWNVGCLTCKRHIWLGSQKPFSWKGFQIENEPVKRFFFLHTTCSDSGQGNLLLTNDGTLEIPWESEKTSHEWQEDILSRTFYFDSYSQGSLVCAGCYKKLNEEESLRKEAGNLQKGTSLWFCEENCFSKYIDQQKNESDTRIYDSTSDHPPKAFFDDSFEIGCTECKTYALIDNQPDSFGDKRDFEYLALFLCEHIGPDHRLKTAIDEETTSWKNPDTRNGWNTHTS